MQIPFPKELMSQANLAFRYIILSFFIRLSPKFFKTSSLVMITYPSLQMRRDPPHFSVQFYTLHRINVLPYGGLRWWLHWSSPAQIWTLICLKVISLATPAFEHFLWQFNHPRIDIGSMMPRTRVPIDFFTSLCANFSGISRSSTQFQFQMRRSVSSLALSGWFHHRCFDTEGPWIHKSDQPKAYLDTNWKLKNGCRHIFLNGCALPVR